MEEELGKAEELMRKLEKLLLPATSQHFCIWDLRGVNDKGDWETCLEIMLN